MQPRQHISPLWFCDDGHPESREYDSNYMPLDTAAPRHWLSVLFRLRAQRAAAAAAEDRRAPEQRTDADPAGRRLGA